MCLTNTVAVPGTTLRVLAAAVSVALRRPGSRLSVVRTAIVTHDGKGVPEIAIRRS